MRIWMVGKDPGGTNGIIPVMHILKKHGHEVRLFLNGKAVELFKNSNEDFVECFNARKIFTQHPPPDVYVTSMCSEGGVGRDLVPLLRGKCPTIALQDFWGARLATDWGDPIYRPDYIIVHDAVGKNVVLDTWKEYDDAQVKVLGYPALDTYAHYDIVGVTKKVRTTLGLTDLEKPVVVFGGQGHHTAQVLKDVVQVLNKIGGDCYFVPRPHPRTKKDYSDEMIPWQEALAHLYVGTSIFDFFEQVSTSMLLAASDLVISSYSTVLIEAVALRKANISYMPSYMVDAFLKESNGVMKEFPLTELGCSMEATNGDELLSAIHFLYLMGNKALRKQQEEQFKVDGESAERVASFIESLA